MIAKPFLRLTPQYRHLLTERFNILGEFDLVAYDNDFAMLNNHLTACKPPSFNVDDRIIIIHYDTDYYMPNSKYGMAIHNLVKTFIAVDISLAVVIFITNHVNIHQDFEDLIPSKFREYNFPHIIDNFITVFHPADLIANQMQNITFTNDISHSAVCMMGGKRIHRNIMFNEFTKHKLLDNIMCSYDNKR
jgi:hypothetical protein